MKKIWLVTRHEYLTYLRRRSFLLSAFGIPLFTILIMFVVIYLSSAMEMTVESMGGLGYVDQAGVLTAQVDKPDLFTSYATEDEARAAYDAGTIGGYFVLPPAYMTSGTVDLYVKGTMSDKVTKAINDYLIANLSAGVDTTLPLARLQDPVSDMTVVVESSGRRLDQNAVIGLFITPMIFAVVFMMASQVTSSYLMAGVVEEKTNRIMEVLITSITPLQMLLGKLFGLGALGLTQLLVWVVAGVALTTVGATTNIPILSGVSIPPDLIITLLVYFVLTYFLMSSVMAGIGAVVGSEQESRQVSSILSLLVVVPFFFILQFMQEPNGTLPVILTMIPFTAAISIILRMSVTTVPTIQLVASVAILLLSTFVVTWASAKVFRWALLLYGKRVGPRELWRVIRRPVEIGTVAASGDAGDGERG